MFWIKKIVNNLQLNVGGPLDSNMNIANVDLYI